MESSPSEILHYLVTIGGGKKVAAEVADTLAAFITALPNELFQSSPFTGQSQALVPATLVAESCASADQKLIALLSHGCMLSGSHMSTLWTKALSSSFPHVTAVEHVTPDVLLEIRQQVMTRRVHCWQVLHEVIAVSQCEGHSYAAQAGRQLQTLCAQGLVKKLSLHLQALVSWQAPSLSHSALPSASPASGYLPQSYAQCINLLYADIQHCLHSLVLLGYHVEKPSMEEFVTVLTVFLAQRGSHPLACVAVLLDHVGPYKPALQSFLHAQHVRINQHLLWLFVETMELHNLYASPSPREGSASGTVAQARLVDAILPFIAVTFEDEDLLTSVVVSKATLHSMAFVLNVVSVGDCADRSDRSDSLAGYALYESYMDDIQSVISFEEQFREPGDRVVQSTLFVELVSVLVRFVTMRDDDSIQFTGNVCAMLQHLFADNAVQCDAFWTSDYAGHPVYQLLVALLDTTQHMPVYVMTLMSALAGSSSGSLPIVNLLSEEHNLMTYLDVNDLKFGSRMGMDSPGADQVFVSHVDLMGEASSNHALTDTSINYVRSLADDSIYKQFHPVESPLDLLTGREVVYVGTNAFIQLRGEEHWATSENAFIEYNFGEKRDAAEGYHINAPLSGSISMQRTAPTFKEHGVVIGYDAVPKRVLVRFSRQVSWWQVLIERYLLFFATFVKRQRQHQDATIYMDVAQYIENVVQVGSDPEESRLSMEVLRLMVSLLAQLFSNEKSRAVALFATQKVYDDLIMYYLCTVAQVPGDLFHHLTDNGATVHMILHDPALFHTLVTDGIPSRGNRQSSFPPAVMGRTGYIEALVRNLAMAMSTLQEHSSFGSILHATSMSVISAVSAEMFVREVSVYLHTPSAGLRACVWTSLDNVRTLAQTDLDWCVHVYSLLEQSVLVHRQYLSVQLGLGQGLAGDRDGSGLFSILHALGTALNKQYATQQNFNVLVSQLATVCLRVLLSHSFQAASLMHDYYRHLDDNQTISMHTLASLYVNKGFLLGGGGVVKPVTESSHHRVRVGEALVTNVPNHTVFARVQHMVEDVCMYLNLVISNLGHVSQVPIDVDYIVTYIAILHALVQLTAQKSAFVGENVLAHLAGGAGATVIVESALQVLTFLSSVNAVVYRNSHSKKAAVKKTMKDMFLRSKQNSEQMDWGSFIDMETLYDTLILQPENVKKMLDMMDSCVFIVEECVHGMKGGAKAVFNLPAVPHHYLLRCFHVHTKLFPNPELASMENSELEQGASMNYFLALWMNLCVHTNGLHVQQLFKLRERMYALLHHVIVDVYADNQCVMEAITLKHISYIYSILSALISQARSPNAPLSHKSNIAFLLATIASRAPELLSLLTAFRPVAVAVSSVVSTHGADKAKLGDLHKSISIYNMTVSDYKDNEMVTFVTSLLTLDIPTLYESHPVLLVHLYSFIDYVFTHAKKFSLLAKLCLHLVQLPSFWEACTFPLNQDAPQYIPPDHSDALFHTLSTALHAGELSVQFVGEHVDDVATYVQHFCPISDTKTMEQHLQRLQTHTLALSIVSKERYGYLFELDMAVGDRIRAKCDNVFVKLNDAHRFTSWMKHYISSSFVDGKDTTKDSGKDAGRGGAMGQLVTKVRTVVGVTATTEQDIAASMYIHGYGHAELVDASLDLASVDRQHALDCELVARHIQRHIIANISAPSDQFVGYIQSHFQIYRHVAHCNFSVASIHAHLALMNAFKQFLEVFILAGSPLKPTASDKDEATSTPQPDGSMSPNTAYLQAYSSSPTQTRSSAFVGDKRSYEVLTDILTHFHHLAPALHPSKEVGQSGKYELMNVFSTYSVMSLLMSMLHHQLIFIQYKDPSPLHSICVYREKGTSRLSQSKMERILEQCISIYNRVCYDFSDIAGYLSFICHPEQHDDPVYGDILNKLVFQSSSSEDINFSLQWMHADNYIQSLLLLDLQTFSPRNPQARFQDEGVYAAKHGVRAALSVKTRLLVLVNILLLLNSICVYDSSADIANVYTQRRRELFASVYDLYLMLHAGRLASTAAATSGDKPAAYTQDLYALKSICIQVMTQCVPIHKSLASLSHSDYSLWGNAINDHKRALPTLITVFSELCSQVVLSAQDYAEIYDYSQTNAAEMLRHQYLPHKPSPRVVSASATDGTGTRREVLRSESFQYILSMMDLLVKLLDSSLISFQSHQAGLYNLLTLLGTTPFITALNSYLSGSLHKPSELAVYMLLSGYDQHSLETHPMHIYIQKSMHLTTRVLSLAQASQTSANDKISALLQTYLLAYTPFFSAALTPQARYLFTVNRLDMIAHIATFFAMVYKFCPIYLTFSSNLHTFVVMAARALSAQCIDVLGTLASVPSSSGAAALLLPEVYHHVWIVSPQEKALARSSIDGFSKKRRMSSSDAAHYDSSSPGEKQHVRFGKDQVYEIPRPLDAGEVTGTGAGAAGAPSIAAPQSPRPSILKGGSVLHTPPAATLRKVGERVGSTTISSTEDRFLQRFESSLFSAVHALLSLSIAHLPSPQLSYQAGSSVYYYSNQTNSIELGQIDSLAADSCDVARVASHPRLWERVSLGSLLFSDKPVCVFRAAQTGLDESVSSAMQAEYLANANAATQRLFSFVYHTQHVHCEEYAFAFSSMCLANADLSTAHLSAFIAYLLNPATCHRLSSYGKEIFVCAMKTIHVYMTSMDHLTRNIHVYIHDVDHAYIQSMRDQVETIAKKVFGAKDLADRGTNDKIGDRDAEAPIGTLPHDFASPAWNQFASNTYTQARDVLYRLALGEGPAETQEVSMDTTQTSGRKKKGGLRDQVDWVEDLH